MIIEFLGPKKGNRDAGAAMVFTAALEAFKTGKKVCIMSLRSHVAGGDIEDVAVFSDDIAVQTSGNAQATISDQFSYSDNGVDGVIRRAETGNLKPEQFDNCVTPTIRAKNGLDILKSTRELRFEEDLADRWPIVEQVIKCADAIYDYVFLYVSPDYDNFLKLLEPMVEKVVVVAKQGKMEEMPKVNFDDKKKVCLLVNDFEEESSWNFRHMKNLYNAKNLYVMPHSVKMKDARENSDLIRFAMKSIGSEKNDINFSLVSEIGKMITWFGDGNASTQYSFADELVVDPMAKDTNGKTLSVHPGTTEVVEETEKSGFFGKKKYKRAIFRPEGEVSEESFDDKAPEMESTKEDIWSAAEQEAIAAEDESTADFNGADDVEELQ